MKRVRINCFDVCRLSAAALFAAIGLAVCLSPAVAEPAVPRFAGIQTPIPQPRPTFEPSGITGALATAPETSEATTSEASDAAPPEPDVEDLATQPMDSWSPLEWDAMAFAHDLTNRALRLLDNVTLPAGEKRSAFKKLVSELFDVKEVGRMLLGHNKDRLDDHQLANYQSVVTDYLVPIYAARLGQICDTQASLISVQERGNTVFVRTEFVKEMGAPPTYVDWLVGKQPDGSWRALDIAVNGVSLVRSKMEEFNAVIQNRGPDAFLELLHDQAGDALPAPMPVPVHPILANAVATN